MSGQVMLILLALLAVIVDGSKWRIFNGQDVEIRDYGFMVSLHLYKGGDYEYLCGGTIISESHIMTAASCVKGKLGNLSNLKIQSGMTTAAFYQSRFSNLRAIHIHPKYKCEEALAFNIAILELSVTMVCIDDTYPVQNLYSVPNLRKVKVQMVGFGKSSPYSEFNGSTLKVLKGKIMRLEECQRALPNLELDESMLCIKHAYGMGMCVGDEGGAAVIRDNRNEYYVQIGILSKPHACIDFQKPDVMVNLGNPEIKKFIYDIANIEVLSWL